MRVSINTRLVQSLVYLHHPYDLMHVHLIGINIER